MKFQLSFSTIILLLWLPCLHGQTVDRSQHQLLWEITGNGFERPSYLFGSMHVEDERVFEFSDSMLICLENCEGFSGELNMDSLSYFIIDEMLSGDTTNILKQNLSPEAYDGLNRRLQNKSGKRIEDMDNKQPWFIDMMMEEDEDDDGKDTDFEAFLDLYLFNYAKKLGKQTYGLEKLEDQLGLSLLKYQTYEEYLTDQPTISSSEGEGDFLEQLTQIYLSGNIQMIDSLYVASMPNDIYKQKLLTDRNIVMADNIERLGKQLPMFNVVGAAHLPGEDGVIAILQQRGYSLRPVSAEFTGKNPLKDLSDVALPWYVLDREKERWCSMEFPAPPVKIKKLEGLDLENFDFYMSMDMFTQEAYLYMCIELSNVSPKKRKIALETLIKETFEGNEELELLEDSPIYDIEYKGMEGLARKGLTTNGLLEMRGFVQGEKLYALYCYSQTDTIKHAHRFFNSFEYFAKKEEVFEGRVVLDSAGIAFNAPVPMKHKVIEGQNGILINNYQGVTEEEDIFYAVQHYNMLKDNYITNENDIIKNIIAGMKMRGGKSFKQYPKIKKDKYNYRKIDFKASGYAARLGYFFRGNRVYAVIITAQSEELADQGLDRLAGSIEMLDIPLPKLEERDCPEAGFSVSLPSPDTVQVVEDITFPMIEYYKISGYDALAAVPCIVEGIQFSPYFKIENIDTFFIEGRDLIKEEHETILSSQRVTYQGFPALDVVYESDSTSILAHVRLVLVGDWMYYITTFLPRELASTDYMDNIVNSLKINLSIERGDILSSKTNKIIADLNTTDKDVYNELQDALDGYKFEEENLAAIYEALRLEIPLDTSDYYYTLKERLIYALDDIGDEASISVLQELFPTFNAQEQMAAIDVVGTLEGDDLDVFWKIAAAAKVEDDEFNTYSVARHLSGKAGRIAKHLPRIMELSKNEYYATDLYDSLLDTESDSLVDMKAVLSPYLPELETRLEQGFELWLTRGKGRNELAYTLQNLVWLLADYSESPSLFAFLEKNITKAQGDILINMAVGLLKNDHPLDKEKWQLLADKELLEDVLWWLSENDFKYGHYAAIPKKYKNQATAARAGMKGYFLRNQEEDFAIVKFVKRKKIKKNGVSYNLYVYELKVKNTQDTALGIFVKSADKSDYSVKPVYYNHHYFHSMKNLDGKVDRLLDYFYED